MQCDVCGRDGARTIKIKTPNGEGTLRLCNACKIKMYQGNIVPTLQTKIPFSVVFGEGAKKSTAKCPKCLTTEEEMIESGYVGCEHCYTEFENKLRPRIAKIQQGIVHIGKRPTVADETPESEYERLSRELKKAVEIEDYDRAARLQKKMKELRSNV